VSHISTARRLGWTASALARAARSTFANTAELRSGRAFAQHRRLGAAIFSGARATLASVSRAMHTLFLQTAGLFFFVFAVFGGAAAYREYRFWSAGQAAGGKLALASAFSVVFAWFALSSFWRASKTQSVRKH
jgi:hypothetical protein